MSIARLPTPAFLFTAFALCFVSPPAVAAPNTAYADHVFTLYQHSLRNAADLRGAINALIARPDPVRLEAARDAWNTTREPYLQTEAFRFYGGPIDDSDGPERLLNAWPMDETYIDTIIADASTYPAITAALVENLNGKDGETNITSGFHALEYLLWGKDTFADGPGRREASAFGDKRFAEYATACTALLISNLRSLTHDWAKSVPRNYRRMFLSLPAEQAARLALSGAKQLSSPELARVRLTTAYESRAQENIHSCFSDTTHRDIIFNIVGIQKVVAIFDPNNTRLKNQIASSLAIARAIPVPFDKAIQGDDSAPGRRAVLALIKSLETQAELFPE